MEHNPKKTAWLLSVFGLTPFLWLSNAALSGALPFITNPVTAFISYSATIIAFLGGMYWMRALTLRTQRTIPHILLYFSVIPSLAGWSALLVEQDLALMILIVSYFGLLGTEYIFMRMNIIEKWFLQLRICISALVIIAHVHVWCNVGAAIAS